MSVTRKCPRTDSETGKPCGGEMHFDADVKYPGEAGGGQGQGQESNRSAPLYGPGWHCEKCGHVEPDLE